MKIIKLKKIDGKNIVNSIGFRVINPERTKRVIREKIFKSDIYKKIEEKANDLIKNKSKKDKDQKLILRLESEILDLNDKLKSKYLDFYNESKVYFELKSDEIEISEEKFKELNDLMKDLKKDQSIEYFNNEFSLMVNKIGKSYYQRVDNKPVEKKIMSIGEDFPEDAFFELTGDDYLLLDGINPEEFKKEMALKDSAQLKIELEIKGSSSSDALSQARSFYAQKIKEIEDEYSSK